MVNDLRRSNEDLSRTEGSANVAYRERKSGVLNGVGIAIVVSLPLESAVILRTPENL